MRHHPENVGVAVLGQNVTGAIVSLGGIDVFNAGHNLGFPNACCWFGSSRSSRKKSIRAPAQEQHDEL
jgi:hypothetical protein